MNLEKALKTAIEYENKVRDTYQEAAEKATSDTGKRVFNVLFNEEQGHIDYLNSRLEQWQEKGKITVEKLDTAIPSRAAIDEAVRFSTSLQIRCATSGGTFGFLMIYFSSQALVSSLLKSSS